MADIGQFLPIILIVAVFWFLIIRPQQRRVRQHRDLVASVQVGDDVLTVGGLHGKVERQDDESIWLKVDDRGTILRFSKSSIGQRLTPEGDATGGES